MATVQSSNRLTLRAHLQNAGADRGVGVPGPSPSLLRALALPGRRLLGVVLLLLGILMMSTLLLLPVGLPLALVALALIAAPGNP
jgi:hypothetical protein